MTSSNGPAIPPRFYAFSALAVLIAVAATWAVTRSAAPGPQSPPPPAVTPRAEAGRDTPPPNAAATHTFSGDAGPTAPLPEAVRAREEADASRALVDVVLPPPATDGGGLPLPLATRAELALVAPLTEGARLGDAQIVVISRVENGVVRVISRRGAETIDLAIALASAGDRPTAAKVGRYAIYHYNTSAPSLAASGLAVELATILRRNVNVPPPPGMTQAPP